MNNTKARAAEKIDSRLEKNSDFDRIWSQNPKTDAWGNKLSTNPPKVVPAKVDSEPSSLPSVKEIKEGTRGQVVNVMTSMLVTMGTKLYDSPAKGVRIGIKETPVVKLRRQLNSALDTQGILDEIQFRREELQELILSMLKVRKSRGYATYGGQDVRLYNFDNQVKVAVNKLAASEQGKITWGIPLRTTEVKLAILDLYEIDKITLSGLLNVDSVVNISDDPTETLL